MASPAACAYGAEEQTVDHVVLHCPIHRLPPGVQGLTVLDNETIEWLLKTCPEDLVRPRELQELTQTMKKVSEYESGLIFLKKVVHGLKKVENHCTRVLTF